MAKKPYHYKELSTRKCRVCGRRLKKSVVKRNPSADLCFLHYQSLIRRNPTAIQKEATDG